MNAKAHRAKRPDPALDTHGPRILCGANGATCALVIAWERPTAAQRVVAIPAGLTDDGTPGIYRWSVRATDKLGEGVEPIVQTRDRAPGYSADHWARVGPVRFARVPCVIPCPRDHKNDVDIG